MALKMKTSTGGGDFEVPPAGNQVAVCVGIIELGSHLEQYQNQPASWKQKVFIVWELAEKQTDGSPFVVGRDYNATLGQKANLRTIIERWRGKALSDDEEFDLTKLINQCCLLSLLHHESKTGNTYAKIESVSSLPKGMPKLAATHKPITWEIGGGSPPPEDDWLPMVYGVKVADKIKASKEMGGNGVAVAQPNGAANATNGNGSNQSAAAAQTDDEAAF